MTRRLFQHLAPSLIERGMEKAYDRERFLLPIVMEMERQGVPVDLARLGRDVEVYSKLHASCDIWLQKRLKAPGLDINKSAEVCKQLLKLKLADPQLMLKTKTGEISTAKESLELGVKDKQLLSMLRYRAALSTCLRTFMEPWLAVAEVSNGKIFTSWNTTRNAAGEVGTKTGRLSSTPNFQNIPNEFKPLFKHEVTGRDKKSLALKASLADAPIALLPLPRVRSYIVPLDRDHVVAGRDYSQQEPRIAAHYEEGPLYEGYKADPWLDVHDHTKAEVDRATGRDYDRKPIKNTGLGILYGMGKGKLAIKNDMTVADADELKKTVMRLIYPGIAEMYKEMRRKARAGEPIHTWGGREYYCEEPRRNAYGRMQEYDYKLVNLLIQGSAADATKEAMLRYYAAKPKHHLMLLQVHDELLVTLPRVELCAGMELLRQAMESVEFDIPLLTEGKWSATNWHDLIEYDKKGVILYAA